ncbi:nitrogen regulation protein NR(II) [Alkanindiges sp. WGS2144]|uniref:two-component system sensor histidine kinase NtrB n=1 Tax=Alkanindiges sp. WGS2144 TaxID=3366808 RepID=UPI003753E2BF
MYKLKRLFPAVQPPHDPAILRRLSLIYSGYRLALSFFLIALFLITLNNPIVGGSEPYLYLNALAGYAFFTLLSYVSLRHWPHQLDNQITFMLVIDICALTVMLYANGGPSLQMSMLYMVVVMAANILLPALRALTIALFAAITVIYQQFFYSLAQNTDIRGISGAALLALSFVGIALFGQLITQRLRLVEQLAQQRYREINQLQAINQQIVEQIETGLLVLDEQRNVLLINKAAQQLAFSSDLIMQDIMDQPLPSIHPQLAKQISQALAQQQYEFLIRPQGKNQDLNIQLTKLQHHGRTSHILVIMQSLQRLNQQVQQLKLASLGQLTASIAHEIRNPLAAISQASELMAESPLETTDRDLLNMIQRQTRRLDLIIENILQMSRRKPLSPQQIMLDEWMMQLINDNLAHFKQYIQTQIGADLSVWFDPLQLQHILVNLLQNAVHHSKKLHDSPVVRVLASQDEQQRIILDVMDSGPGVSAKAVQTLFEPFFTTEPNGTGLGLYLSRAFCEANDAQLLYIPQTRGACFRIVFRSPTQAC